MSDLNRFDRVAPFYDRLKRIVFGRAIHLSEMCFLHLVKHNARVLVLGGGTGGMLRALLKGNDSCVVWYVEASEKMLELARGKTAHHASRIVFIHGTETSLPANIDFDVIITNFFLDLFPASNIADIVRIIGRHLARDGRWIITDFVDSGKWWQRLLLAAMYRFFRLTCHIDAHALPSWENILKTNGFGEDASWMFYGDFIKSSVWTKSQS